MRVGQGLKPSRPVSPRGDGKRQQGTGVREVIFPGQRPRAGETSPPEEMGSSHTDHASSAAAAPAPRARAGTVAERVKAQDSSDAISDQHHLGERPVPSEAGGRWAPVAGSPRTSLTPDLPTEAGALRRAQESGVGLVGAGDDSGHSALVSGG